MHHKSQQQKQAEQQNAALITDVQKGVEIIQKLSEKSKVLESKVKYSSPHWILFFSLSLSIIEGSASSKNSC